MCLFLRLQLLPPKKLGEHQPLTLDPRYRSIAALAIAKPEGLSVIPPEVELGTVPLHVLPADEMEDADNASLEQAEVALRRIRVNEAS